MATGRALEGQPRNRAYIPAAAATKWSRWAWTAYAFLVVASAPCAAQETWAHRCGPPPAGFPDCGPAARNLHVSAYAGFGRAMIQGGNNGHYLSDAWLWDGQSW